MNILRAFRYVTLIGVTAASLAGQSGTDSTSDFGPLASTQGGNPASSYALSSIAHVNYFNGNFNIAIPLVKIGGRGTSGYTMILPIEQRWSVQKVFSGSNYSYQPVGTARNPTQYGYFSDPTVYSPGTLELQTSSAQPGACYDDITTQGWYDLGPYLTRIVWTASDGTQTSLLDTAYGGQSQGTFPNNGSACGLAYNYQPANRGRVFNSSDGSGISFVADADVHDTNGLAGGGSPSGTLHFRDGTKYTIDQYGWVERIEDRNGNITSLSYGNDSNTGFWNSITITDSLNRTTAVNTYSDHDTIMYPGANNQQHVISVNRGPMDPVMDRGTTPQPLKTLFPELDGSDNTVYDPWVITSVTLADRSSYSFLYNPYGEPNLITLPTGGRIRYEIQEAQSCNNSTGSGVIQVGPYSDYSVYRRVTRKDEFADGYNLSSITELCSPTYGNADSQNLGRSTTTAEIHFEDQKGTLLRKESHSFYGNPSGAEALPDLPTDYAKWTDGLEFQSTAGDAGATLQTVYQSWEQRPCAGGENCWFDPQNDASPEHGSRIRQRWTMLDNNQSSAVNLAYDQFNNITGQQEFNYGPANSPFVAGAMLRETLTTYHTEGQYLDPNVNLISLPFETRVRDGSGQQRAYALRWYDEVDVDHNLSDAPGIGKHDSGYNTGYNARGNLTSVWRSQDGSDNINNLSQYNYDIAGNVVAQRDPNGNFTCYSYNDDGANQYAFPTRITNALNQSTVLRYDYGAGKLSHSADGNNVSTDYAYNDPLDRLIQTVQAGIQTNYQYPNPTTVIRYQDQNNGGDRALQSETDYDPMGRVAHQRTVESGSASILTDTIYDSLAG